MQSMFCFFFGLLCISYKPEKSQHGLGLPGVNKAVAVSEIWYFDGHTSLAAHVSSYSFGCLRHVAVAASSVDLIKNNLNVNQLIPVTWMFISS